MEGMTPLNEVNEYRIVSANDANALAAEVTRLVREGWQPIGGLQVVCPVLPSGAAPAFYQAMATYI
jgi:hypothetical protein